ncbi:MAG: transposase [Chloroflexota bacterium]|nr:transposase [Chloroflexota bacterium]
MSAKWGTNRERPTRVVEREPRVSVAVDEAAVEKVVRQQGWRVYATNAPAAQLPLSQAVLAYRGQYIVERGCGRLKGRPLSLTPMYLERDDHATGLIRLLSIGLRVLTLLEFVVRQRLAKEGTELAGLYAGNLKRTTARPTVERILEAFHLYQVLARHHPHDHSGTPSHPSSSHATLPATTAHPDVVGSLAGYLHQALRQFFQTALKMSEP